MSDLFFLFKMMFLTLVAALLMQIRVGGATIENHAMVFLTTSSLVGPIDDTAQASVIFIRNSWNRIAKTFNTRFSNSLREGNQPGTRLSGLRISRSEAVEKSQQKTAAENNSDSDKSSFEKLKQRAMNAGAKIKSRFIDETRTPGDAAATPQEDEFIEE